MQIKVYKGWDEAEKKKGGKDVDKTKAPLDAEPTVQELTGGYSAIRQRMHDRERNPNVSKSQREWVSDFNYRHGL